MLREPDELTARVHQASGMVAQQLGCDVFQALVALRVQAEHMGQSLEHTALDVLDGLLRFCP